MVSVLVFNCCCNNYHKLRGLKQNKFIIYSFVYPKPYKSHWAKIKAAAGLCSFLVIQEENTFPCFFQLLEVTTFICLPLLLHLQSQKWQIKFFSHHINLVSYSVSFSF
jgi:hypothetical protein